MDVLAYLNLILPIAACMGVAYAYKCTKRIENLIMLPSLIYISVYYAIYLYTSHVPGFAPGALQTPFRVGITLLLLCLLIKIAVDIYRACKIGKH